eukprot:TRINITY_DN21747_c0_g2_i1.p1 TRINITY_DN21747_c0_g2~~TRINITY_DN21747_c0_g2_i1.p1  ORF type:complete len:356 (+),score=59.20 TRINITY_DN21747_c0_g2_i1:95-1162(+)
MNARDVVNSDDVENLRTDSSGDEDGESLLGAEEEATCMKLPESVFGYMYFTMIQNNKRGGTSKCLRMLHAASLAFLALGAQSFCVKQLRAMSANNPIAEKFIDDSWGSGTPKNAYLDWGTHPDDGNHTNDVDGEFWRTWVCRGEDWSFQGDKINDMKEYLSDENGKAFVLVVLIIWSGYALKEVGEIYWFSTISWSSGLPCSYQVVLVLTVLGRMAVMVGLMWYGSIWLCHSETLKDVLLNGVALNFVYELDELMLSACVVRFHREALKEYEEKVPGTSPERTLFVLEVLGVLVAILIAAFFTTQYLSEFQNQYLFAYCGVCGELETETCKDSNSWAQMVALSKKVWPERYDVAP